MRALNASETKVLSMAIKREPGMTLCSTWMSPIPGRDDLGRLRRPRQSGDTGRRQRAAHLPGDELAAEYDGPSLPPDHLAQRILDGLAQPGVHRALSTRSTGRY